MAYAESVLRMSQAPPGDRIASKEAYFNAFAEPSAEEVSAVHSVDFEQSENLDVLYCCPPLLT